jgi:hypothetical protein
MKAIKIIFAASVILLCFSCKKELVKPETNGKVGVYYWNTDYNYLNYTAWLRKKDNSVWTWYYYSKNGMLNIRSFNSDNGYELNHNLSKQQIYREGKFGNLVYPTQYANIVNERNNIEYAYFSLNDGNEDTTIQTVQLCTGEIDNAGGVHRGKTLDLHYAFDTYLESFKFVKTNTNYYFGYHLYLYDSLYNTADTLYILKTDLDLNVIGRVTYADTLGSSFENLRDMKMMNGNLVLIYNIYNYPDNEGVVEILDKDLNLLHTSFLSEDIPESSAWDKYEKTAAYSKIIPDNDGFNVIGSKHLNKSVISTILWSTFSSSGEFLSSRQINTLKPSATIRGIEPSTDGKTIIYYSEGEDENDSYPHAGVAKVDKNGAIEYQFIFPENDPNGYVPCMVYENSDGSINMYGVRSSQQASQTFFVKIDRSGNLIK